MITADWREELAEHELEQVDLMLRLAVAYDEEPGFSTATPSAPSPGAHVRHLLVGMPPKGERGSEHLDRLPEAEVVAYLRVDVQDGVGSVQLVVRPEFRSLGVATLLFERLADPSDGWSSVPGLRSLRAWAHGAHPAAERMSLRFDGRLDHALFKTLRQIGGSRPFRGDQSTTVQRTHGAEVPELVPGHYLTMAPGEYAALGLASSTVSLEGDAHVVLGADSAKPAVVAAVLALVHDHARREDLRTLLTQGLLDLQETGARTAQLYVDALDDTFVAVSRELEFVHDQSDLLYVRDLPG